MRRSRSTAQLLLTLAGCIAAAATQAASVYLTPASSSPNLSAGTTTLELFMDFTGEPTIGGGVDFDVSGPISIASFTPSAFFNTLDTAPDNSDFTGYGTTSADNDFEVHFGKFDGISGVEKLGDFTLNLLALGAGQINVSINSTFGEFFPTVGTDPISVTLTGAEVNVVPLPATAWLMITGFGIAGFWRRRRS